MNPKASATLIAWLAVVCLFALPAISEAQTVDAGVVKLPDAEIEYFSQKIGEKGTVTTQLRFCGSEAG